MQSTFDDSESSFNFEEIDQFLNEIMIPTQYYYGHQIQLKTNKTKALTKADIIELNARKKQLLKHYNFIKASRVSNSNVFYLQSLIRFKSSEKFHQKLIDSINTYQSLKQSVNSLKETIFRLKKQIDQQKFQQFCLKSEINNYDSKYIYDNCLSFQDNIFCHSSSFQSNLNDIPISDFQFSSLEKMLSSIQTQNLKTNENLENIYTLQKEAISSLTTLYQVQLKHFQLQSQITQIKHQNSQILDQIEKTEDNIQNLKEDIFKIYMLSW